jgi:hypothetical protein
MPNRFESCRMAGLWSYEAKLDGYRCLAAKRSSGMGVRRSKNFTKKRNIGDSRVHARISPSEASVAPWINRGLTEYFAIVASKIC